MINRRSGFLIIIFLIHSWFLFSQEARISVQLDEDQILEWSVSDENYSTIISSEMYDNEDSIDFFLPVNQHYYLDVSIIDPGFSDSIVFNLQINGNDILTILDTKEGDLSLPFFTGNFGNQLKIIGGTDADIEDFPWQVYLRAGNYLCGGSIISEKWVLTAAHCAFDEDEKLIPPEEMSIKVGTSYPGSLAAGDLYYVENVIIHEGYTSEGYLNDIALLELKETIDFSVANYIELISIDEVEAGAADPGVLSWVTGWGLTSIDPDEFPSSLQKVELPIVANASVRSVWGNVHESVLMAGYLDGNKDACKGDSGGPLVVPVGRNYRLAGIVSWGAEDCSTYGGYTSISSFEDWIRSNSGVERRFIPDEPYGDSIICQTVLLTEYTPIPVVGVNNYEWILIPAEAGTIHKNNNVAEVNWSESFIGTAELGIRGFFDGAYTEWTYKSIEKVNITSVISQSVDTSLCSGFSIVLSVDAEGRDLFYTWTRNGEFLNSGSENLISFHSLSSENSGNYLCEINGMCGNTTSENIFLDVYPTTEITFTSKDQDLNIGDGTILEVISEGHDLSYFWYKDGNQIPEEDLSYLVINELDAEDIGNYTAAVSGTCGTEESDSIYLFVSGKKDNEVENARAILWPTLLENEMTIAIDSDEIYNITIYDLYGKLIRSIPDCQYQTVISGNDLSSGTYILKLDTRNYQETFRFIVL